MISLIIALSKILLRYYLFHPHFTRISSGDTCYVHCILDMMIQKRDYFNVNGLVVVIYNKILRGL